MFKKIIFILILLTSGLNSLDLKKIIGGEKAELGDIPYQVLIYTLVETHKSHSCGGSIIKQTVVLTAAHCVFGKFTEVVLKFGLIHRDSTPKWTATVGRRSVRIHRDYENESLDNDIAMIYVHIPDSVFNSPHVKPIALPEKYRNETFAGYNAKASGFGYTSDQDHSLETYKQLMYVFVKIISHSTCANASPNHRFYIRKKFHVCIASDPFANTCQGDSGGPLAVEMNGSWVLVGITSYGLTKKCESTSPNVFTRVTNYLDWIAGSSSRKASVVLIVMCLLCVLIRRKQ